MEILWKICIIHSHCYYFKISYVGYLYLLFCSSQFSFYNSQINILFKNIYLLYFLFYKGFCQVFSAKVVVVLFKNTEGVLSREWTFSDVFFRSLNVKSPQQDFVLVISQPLIYFHLICSKFFLGTCWLCIYCCFSVHLQINQSEQLKSILLIRIRFVHPVGTESSVLENKQECSPEEIRFTT